MKKIIKHYASGKTIVEIKNGKFVIDWVGFAHLWDCVTDDSVLEHTVAAVKQYAEVKSLLLKHKVFLPWNFTGEAYEVVTVPIEVIEVEKPTAPGIKSFPPQSHIRYNRAQIVRFVKYETDQCEEYLRYRIEPVGSFFKNKKDAIACAEGYKSHREKSRMWTDGEIQVRKVHRWRIKKEWQKEYIEGLEVIESDARQ